MPSAPSTDSRPQIPTQGRSTFPQARRIDSHTLLGGENLVLIEHAGSNYVLRMTRNNKLILTK